MGLFQDINAEARKRNLDFLVIGGLAVNFYGYSRDTADLDLLICRAARQAWLELFSELKYVLERDADAFIQFAPPEEGLWPVDLMLVGEPTFSSTLAVSLERELYGAPMRIPSLEHLLALKLHALKHTRLHRFLKDFQDVEGLVLINRINLKRKEFANSSSSMVTW